MIISQTPLRMSLVGGGTDMPVFYRRFGGAVLSTAIGAYVYVTVNKKFDHWIRVSYSKTEEVEHPQQLEHKSARAILKMLNISGGVEITSIADIPSRGTGLGSSSSFTVGLLHALHAYQGQYVSAKQLGEEGSQVEIDICGEAMGKQDQYAAAYGGLNLIKFEPDDSVIVEPIICGRNTLEYLERDIMVFYTGLTRSASPILIEQARQAEQSSSAQAILRRMMQLALMLRDELQRNNLTAFGEILHENWMLKKEITPDISNDMIDTWYVRARNAGALGGKLLGAGGGGFLIFYASPDRHGAIEEALADLRRVTFKFEKQGSRIIFFQELSEISARTSVFNR